MIHHLSVAADEPERVARVFAELLEGFAIPFPPKPGAFLAVARDGHGTGVEVYPAGTVLEPNGGAGVRFAVDASPARRTPVHFALSVGIDAREVEAIAAREGWLWAHCSRGGDFDVIEVWVENRWMVEVLPPAYAARYVAFTRRMAGASEAEALMASHKLPALA